MTTSMTFSGTVSTYGTGTSNLSSSQIRIPYRKSKCRTRETKNDLQAKTGLAFTQKIIDINAKRNGPLTTESIIHCPHCLEKKQHGQGKEEEVEAKV